MEANYKKTVAGSIGAGLGAIFNANGRKYYILEHKTNSQYHSLGEAQKIIVDQIELGRDSSCQVRFDDSFETVSRKHAAIVREGENYKLIPLSTTNGTYVNGQPIQSDYILNSGDEIRLSSRGPVMGFIIPQGAQSMVKSIGLTERMNLFRKQALRPYKIALWILFVVLVLSVGCLVGWNIWQSKIHEETVKQQQEQIDNMMKENDEILDQMTEKDEQIEKLTRKMNSTSSMSVKETQALREQIETLNKEKQELADKQEQLASNIANMMSDIEDDDDVVIDNQPVVEPQAPAEFADIKECYPAAYYIKMDNLAVYHENNQLARFKTDKLVGGTGFLLEDGRFITARRVIEPWFYFTGVIGEDDRDEWRFEDIQAAVTEFECDIVAEFTAYGPDGVSFSFKNTNMHGDSNFLATSVNVTTFEYRVNRYLRKEFRQVRDLNIQVFNKSTKTDWMVAGKKDQLNTVKGLKFSNDYSRNVVAGDKVYIIGYPLGKGMKNSISLDPTAAMNNINVGGLNDVGVIELASRRYQQGNDGAPVLVQIDGSWTVIGVLSHTDGADRDVVVPIHTVK